MSGCPRCGESLEAGHQFCVHCGRPLEEEPPVGPCTECAVSEGRGHRFCVRCGRPVGRATDAAGRSPAAVIVGIAGLSVTAVCALLLPLDLLALAISYADIFQNLYHSIYQVNLWLPVRIFLFDLSGPSLQAYFVLITIGVAASVAYILLRSADVMRKEPTAEGAKRTPLYSVCTLTFAAAAFQVGFFLLAALFGQGTGYEPEIDQWKLMFGLLNASIFEEINDRVFLLGLPMLILVVVARRKAMPLWRYVVGGFGVTPAAVVLILFSATMFGISHYESWGWVKVIPATAAGIAFGYLFVRFGLYAAVTAHFITDYMQSVLWLAPGAALPYGLLIIVLTAAGAVMLLQHSAMGLRFLADWRRKDFWTGEDVTTP